METFFGRYLWANGRSSLAFRLCLRIKAFRSKFFAAYSINPGATARSHALLPKPHQNHLVRRQAASTLLLLVFVFLVLLRILVVLLDSELHASGAPRLRC